MIYPLKDALSTNEAVSAYDEVTARDEETAKLEVPKNPALAVTDPETFVDPVICNDIPVALLETNNDPVITADPLNGKPVPDPPPVPTDAVVKILLVVVSNTRTLFAEVVSVNEFN